MSWESGTESPEDGRGASLLRRLQAMFPEREVFLRADGRVRYISVSGQAQILAAGAVVALVLWSAVTTGLWLLHDRALASRDATIARQQHAFDALVGQVDTQRRAVAEVGETLRRSQTLLHDLLGPEGAVDTAASTTAPASVASPTPAAGGGDDALRAERERALRRLANTLAEVNALGSSLSKNTDAVQAQLRNAIDEREEMAAARRELQRKVAELETTLASAAARAAVQERDRRALSEQVDTLAAQSRRNARERDRFRHRSRDLETQLAEAVTQSTSLQSALHAANRKIDSLGAQYAAVTRERETLRGKTQGLLSELSQSAAQSKGLQSDLNVALAEIEALATEKAEAFRARDAQRERSAALTTRLAKTQSHAGALQDGLDATKARLDALASQYADMTRERDRYRGQAQGLRNKLADAGAEYQDLEAQLRGTAERLDALAAVNEATGLERNKLRTRTAELENKLAASADRSEDLTRNLYAVTAQLDQVSEQARRFAGERDSFREEYEEVQESLVETRERHQLAITRLLEATSSEIARSEKLLAMTGVDVETMLTDNGVVPLAQGGPFVAPGPLDSTIDSLTTGSALLDLHIDRWEGLQSVFRALPLTPPVDNSYITSGFGRRTDPITKGPAVHHGIDFAGRRKTLVMAAAPGVVSHAGRRGFYGNLIEIDHGFGVRTRYAHLSKVLVEKGDHVSYREEIGRMGSTGRSTGTHLHYEILVDNRPVDPLKFLDVGRYLTKPLPRPWSANVIIPKPKPARSAS